MLVDGVLVACLLRVVCKVWFQAFVVLSFDLDAFCSREEFLLMILLYVYFLVRFVHLFLLDLVVSGCAFGYVISFRRVFDLHFGE